MKRSFWAVIMMTIVITATAGVKGAWPTTCKLPAWPVEGNSVVKLPTELIPSTDGKISSEKKLPAWPSGQAFSVEEPDTTVYHPAEK